MSMKEKWSWLIERYTKILCGQKYILLVCQFQMPKWGVQYSLLQEVDPPLCVHRDLVILVLQ